MTRIARCVSPRRPATVIPAVGQEADGEQENAVRPGHLATAERPPGAGADMAAAWPQIVAVAWTAERHSPAVVAAAVRCPPVHRARPRSSMGRCTTVMSSRDRLPRRHRQSNRKLRRKFKPRRLHHRRQWSFPACYQCRSHNTHTGFPEHRSRHATQGASSSSSLAAASDDWSLSGPAEELPPASPRS